MEQAQTIVEAEEEFVADEAADPSEGLESALETWTRVVAQQQVHRERVRTAIGQIGIAAAIGLRAG